YADALKEAQQKGYAETNPASDVNGSDAEAKLLLLSLVAFGLQVEPGKIWRKGIEEIQAVDFRYAKRIGNSTIKQLSVARRKGSAVQVFVSPALVPGENFLAGVDGATNAICFAGKNSGAPSLVPPGSLRLQAENEIDVPFYVRFVVQDRAGIVGDIGRVFGRIGVNISEIWQLRHVEEEIESLRRTYRLKQKYHDILPFVMTLERTSLRQMRRALDSLRNRDYILIEPVWFPIWS